MEENFKYEFTSEPTMLFTNGMMRKSGKLVLRNHLFNKHPPCDCPSSRTVVIHEGALLHKVKCLSFLICRHHQFLSNIYKTNFLGMKVSSISSMVTTKNCRLNLLNSKEGFQRLLQQMPF